MGRTANKPTEPVTDVVLNPTAVAKIEAAQDALAVMEQETEAKVRAIALSVGYGGTLSVGALEDEIRFYQRRTVEAILETGKRLLVLKEITPHGEFQQRVEMLGFAKTTAFRFMQAAAKTAKSSNLELLSTQVKSASAFLELVTHDDDTLESLVEMDDIDRMSASELRAAVRQAKQDNKFIAEKRDKEMQRADKAEQALKTGPKLLPLSERLADLMTAVDKAHNDAASALLDLTQQAQALDAWWLEEATQMPGYDPEVITPMPAEVQAVAQKMHDGMSRLAVNVNSLQQRLHDEYGHNLAQAV